MAAPHPLPPLRFHLMIGAASSGKSTAARLLSQALHTIESAPVRYVSSADIRQQLYGDSACLGHWQEIETVIQQQLEEAIDERATVILEASYVRRAFRLAITQALHLSAPIQWVGWWLDTPLEQCLAWNDQRQRPVPEAVIRRQCAQLLQSAPVPQRQEGFVHVVRLQTGQGIPLDQLIAAALPRLDPCIQRGANRDAAHELHGYSRLLDLERLLYLLRLLCDHPQLTATDAALDPELQQLLAPLPPAGVAPRAAALLGRLHGACYNDPSAIAADLDWLDAMGFSSHWQQVPIHDWPVINPPPWPSTTPRPIGGLPRLADRVAFLHVFSLLRHLLHHPHDRDGGERVSRHLAQRLTAAAGGEGRFWTPRQVQAALQDTLTPYGFRSAGRSGRRGYALGTALLSKDQLLTTCQLLQLHANDLGDPHAQALATVLHDRLAHAGLQASQLPTLRRWLQPTPPPSTQLQGGLPTLEAAIEHRRRILGSIDGHPSTLWPLQLLLHDSRWWLLLEHDAIGQPLGLLAAVELQQLHVFQQQQGHGRSIDRHHLALQRAEALQRHCGGLHFGGSLADQQACLEGDPAVMAQLRFRCSPAGLAAIERDLHRFSDDAVQWAAPLPGDRRQGPKAARRGNLLPSADPLHPYPVVIDLPHWVLTGDPLLRRWLFSYGPDLRLDEPQALVAEHRRWLQQSLALHHRPRKQLQPRPALSPLRL